ncbi:MAG: divergent polysaccharide deacetylase family protein [Candidatus Omnitrophota bacterium]
MSKSRRKFKHKKLNPAKKTNFLVIVLTIIVLVETVLLLFLIPRKGSVKDIGKTIQKSVSETAKKTPLAKEEKAIPVETTVFPRVIPMKPRGKIAIVIDDWGYSNKNLHILKEIHLPLTLAILPFRDYSSEIAEFGYQNNFEVIIHMPMEPENKENFDLEPKTLMTYMGRRTINSIMNEAFNDIVYAKGINNHMGSLATQDKDFMEKVFKILKKKGFYFLDSYVIADSVADAVAKKLGVKFARRSIFLDNESDPDYIIDRLNELAREVDKNGKAVGICHDRKNTLLALKEELPKLAKKGYGFVFLSDIVE